MRGRLAQILCGAVLIVSVLPSQGVAQQQPRPFRPRPRARNGQPALPELLRRVIAAASSLKLYGERLVDQRVQGQLVRHSELVLRDGNRTRIEFPPDSRFSGQIILDDGNTRRRWNPRNRTINEQPSPGDDTLNRLVGPKRVILRPRVSLADGGLVAGIQTTKATIMNGQGVVVQELYVDPQTGAVLKRVGYDRTSQIVAYFEYTSVRYNPMIPRNAWSFPGNARKVITPENTLKENANKIGLPPAMIKPGQGFRLASSKRVVKGGVDVLEETYLGPSGRLSVFVLRHDVDPKALQNAGKNINSFVTHMNGATVVLIGPYPGTLLVRLTDSLVTP